MISGVNYEGDTMHFLDIILGVVLLLFFFGGIKKGFVSIVTGFVCLIATFILIRNFGVSTKIYLINQFEFSELLATILSYVLIIVLVTIIGKLIVLMMKKILSFLNLSGLDRLLGGIFNIINYGILLAIILMLLEISPFAQQVDGLTNKSIITKYVKAITSDLKMKYPQLNEKTEELQKKISQ